MEKLFDIIRTVLKNRGKKSDLEIKENSHLRNELGLDSLDLAELTVRIEAEFDVDVFENGIVNTVEEIVLKIQNKE